MTEYKPIDPMQFPRFAGIKTFMRLPYKKTTTDIDFAIIGVPWDGGASFRTSQRSGPDAIRLVSALLKPYNLVQDVGIFNHCAGVDYGDLPVIPGYIEDTFARIEEGLHPLVADGVIPILLGGDHSITLPELRAVAQKHGPVALIHYDAHTDTNDAYFGRPLNHGTPFRRAAEEKLVDPAHSIQIGMRGSAYSHDAYDESRSLGFDLVTMDETREIGIPKLIERVRSRAGAAKVFVSFDIDAVDPAFAPGTGTPEVGGFTSAEAIELVRGLKGLNMIGADVVEVLPEYDHNDITSLLAANIVFELMSLVALLKKAK